jgi:hypothetical protein
MAERNSAVEQARRMMFRIGVNVGDVISDGDRIYGDRINVAARLEVSQSRAASVAPRLAARWNPIPDLAYRTLCWRRRSPEWAASWREAGSPP